MNQSTIVPITSLTYHYPLVDLNRVQARSSDAWPWEDHESHMYGWKNRDLVEKCYARGICLCSNVDLQVVSDDRRHVLEQILREHEKMHTPYLHWSVKNLQAVVEKRKIALPKKRTKFALTTILLASDSKHPFRLMDLPTEIRLRIYSMALSDGQDVVVSKRRGVAEPALLQTTVQIRSEATPVFYSSNRFCFELQASDDYADDQLPQSIEASEWGWLQLIDHDKLKSIRHVSFCSRTHKVWIDLTSLEHNTWTISTVDSVPKCPCKSRKDWTLLHMRKHFSINARLEALDPTINPVDACIMTVMETTQSFQNLCHTGEKLELTLPGLSILAKAATSVLDTRFVKSRLLVLYSKAHA